MELFNNPWLLISGIIISTIGLGLFLHGKRMENLRNLSVGVALMALPIFVHSLLVLWLLTGAGLAAMRFVPDGQ